VRPSAFAVLKCARGQSKKQLAAFDHGIVSLPHSSFAERTDWPATSRREYQFRWLFKRCGRAPCATIANGRGRDESGLPRHSRIWPSGRTRRDGRGPDLRGSASSSPICAGIPRASSRGDEGGPFGFGDQVADPKPPQAAVVKSHGGECYGSVGTMIPAGMVKRGERKRIVREISKAD
jgi:hypothetical protein